jgi:hypothetical protein
VRLVRILGLCLAAFFALSAMTAGQAMAKEACKEYGTHCETMKEHESFQAFAACPFAAKPEFCAVGSSYGYATAANGKPLDGKEGPVSYFTAGKVTVDLTKPIRLNVGLAFTGTQNEFFAVSPAEGPAIEPVAQKAPPVTEDVNTALLSQSELERYDYWVHIEHNTKTSAVIEAAGPIESLVVNLANIIGEHGTAFVFPVKVHLISPFAGPDCYVGSDANPIDVPFTTGEAGELRGTPGKFAEESEEILVEYGQRLVSDNFASPGVENCGINGGADEAIDSALGLPSASGNTSLLNSVFRLVVAEEAQRGLKGEI